MTLYVHVQLLLLQNLLIWEELDFLDGYVPLAGRRQHSIPAAHLGTRLFARARLIVPEVRRGIKETT